MAGIRALTLIVATLILLSTISHTRGIITGMQTESQPEVVTVWRMYIFPTNGSNIAAGTCIFGDYVAVVGMAENEPYVFLLHKNNGSVMDGGIAGERGAFFNCISIGEKLYAVGYTIIGYSDYGLIYVFDSDANVLARTVGREPSFYYSLAYDGRILYIGGLGYDDVNKDGYLEPVWLIEKWNSSSLSLITSRKIYFGSWKLGWVNDVGVEPSTGRIWAVGFYEDSSNKTHSLITILDSNFNVARVIDYPEGSNGYLGMLIGVTFDGKGYVYVLGDYGVAKFSLDGELVAVNRDYRARSKIVYGYGYLYSFGIDIVGGYLRHVLYIHDTNLSVVKEHVLSENVNASSLFSLGRPALEEGIIYVAGYDYLPGPSNSRIVVYAIQLRSASTVVQPTQTWIPLATTVTKTIVVPTNITITIVTPITRNITVTSISTTTLTKIDTVYITVTTSITTTITLEKTVTVERVLESSVTVEKPMTITEVLTVARLTVVDRMTTPAMIGLIVAGIMLSAAVLFQGRRKV